MMNEIVIESGHGELQYWRDLWRYRELLFYLALRDILVRYKQTVIGIGWSVLRPLIIMLVMTYVFGTLAKFPSDNVPYPIMVFCGMLPWQFFSNAFSESSNSIIANSGMITKVYFPRLLIPASSVITSIIDAIISGMMLAAIMMYYNCIPDENIVYLPIFIFLALLVALGSGIWISALMVRYRDFRFIVPFIVQFGLYISPVGYDSSKIDSTDRWIYSLNPMVGIIDGVRWSLLGNDKIFIPAIYMSAITIAIINISGVWYFRRNERSFADII